LDSITILLIALGLAMDCFAVALGIGCSPTPKDFRTYFRIAFHFGLFQGGMTFLGWLGGSTIAHLISNFDHWIAFGLLAFVGARMIRESLSKNEEEDPCNPSRGKTLIGFTSLLLSVLGLFIGGRLGCKFGKRMELIGGLVLIGIGFRVLLSHLLG